MNTRIVTASFSAVLCLSMIPATGLANSDGITGRSTTGCTCHGNAADSSTIVRIEGPTTAAPNEVVMLRFVLESPTRARGGFNISSTMGTLASSAPDARVSSGELTHRGTLSRSAGASSIVIPFTWMAPNVAGAQTIRAAGNAVNGNGSTGGDGWNRATHTITVMMGMTDSGVGDGGNIVPPDAALPDVQQPDSSTPPADTGFVPTDTGVSPEDASVAPTDTGIVRPPSDGSAPQDASVPADGGMTMMTGGCGCTSAPAHVDPRGALAALAALGALVTRRRARR
jgi:MYXO-CTERM domain-containing protein